MIVDLVAYDRSGSWIDLLGSCISHVSWFHASKNLTLLAICLGAFWIGGIRMRWIALLSFALPINYAYAHLVGPVMGASGGTFALLGVVTVVVYRRHRWATLALVPLAVHQVTIATPEIAVAHTVAWIVGMAAKTVAIDRETDTERRKRRRYLPKLS